MNWYKRSLKRFKKVIRKNPNTTREEWEAFAQENCYFSSITLEAHNDVYKFEDLKKIYLEKFLGIYIW